ncbi:MAG: hypothetical protein JWQ96_241 [Segetibacter sp.]|nr:hypothetical protein [Segetibacter sp.]
MQPVDAEDLGIYTPPPPPPPPVPTGAAVDTIVIVGAGLQDTVRQVYIGKAILRKNYDALISFTGNGGGSEIVFCRASGYLQMDSDDQVNQNQNFDRVAVKFTRFDVDGVFTFSPWGMVFNNPWWKKVNSEWDNNWKPQNYEQVFAVYEEDNRSEITTSGTISTTLDSLGISVSGTLNWTLKENHRITG